MRPRDRDEPLDPGVERDLDAVDRAIAGREVEPDQAGWAELTALLADECPEPAPGWSEELDRRMAEGFHAVGGEAWDAWFERLRGIKPFRLLAPAGALTVLLVAVVIGVSTLGEGGSDSQTSQGELSLTSGESGDDDSASSAVAPEATTLEEVPEGAALAEGGGDATLDGSSRMFDRSSRDQIAPGTANRRVERDVSLTLSTRPDDVRSTTDEAIAITRSLDGIVISSQVSEAGRQARATLELTIPSRNLDAAVDRLTALANVRSLNESTLDITKPFVSAQDRLEDAEALRLELLEALGNADTADEAAAIQRQIDASRREISRAESAFENIARRARLSDLSLTIEGDPGADDGTDEGRTFGDWLDDTASVLRDLAGVLLISAAILVPLAIITALGWFGVAILRRRRREAALEG